MAVFNKKIQEEREAEKVKEEADGVELTDEVKLERNRRRLEDHHKQLIAAVFKLFSTQEVWTWDT